ncbi:MAG: HAD family hydrolase [Clostridia bacterium]|nr:HAD family hydrolase [Clostridia bacterium]
MKLKLVLFDLDGTLLPLDMDHFMKVYFSGLAKKLAPLGYEAKSLVDAIWTGTAAMVKNTGEKTNEAVFWDAFASVLGEHVRADEPHFAAYYEHEFDEVKNACGYTPKAAKTVADIRAMGYRVALATNPLFPSIATQKRIAWAGLSPSDFELFTTYENSRHCKPNLDYYRDVLTALDVHAEECLMVGNDVDEDMVAEKLGMKVFLLTDCLLNKQNADISKYPQGSFDELMSFIEKL